jgi:hypothetical protein
VVEVPAGLVYKDVRGMYVLVETENCGMWSMGSGGTCEQISRKMGCFQEQLLC